MDDCYVSLTYGYSVSWFDVEQLFALPARPGALPGDRIFSFEGKQFDNVEDLIEEWCGKFGWCFMHHADWNHCAPHEVLFHLSPAAMIGVGDMTVEGFMRLEDQACNIGFKLRDLGFTIEGPPKITYAASIFR